MRSEALLNTVREFNDPHTERVGSYVEVINREGAIQWTGILVDTDPAERQLLIEDSDGDAYAVSVDLVRFIG
jgi:hypothetical protein